MKPMIAAVAAAIAMACAPATQAPTPTVGGLEAVRDGETDVLLARVVVGGSVVGFALFCDVARPLMTVYLGPFPPRLQALQAGGRTKGLDNKELLDVFSTDKVDVGWAEKLKGTFGPRQ